MSGVKMSGREGMGTAGKERRWEGGGGGKKAVGKGGSKECCEGRLTFSDSDHDDSCALIAARSFWSPIVGFVSRISETRD